MPSGCVVPREQIQSKVSLRYLSDATSQPTTNVHLLLTTNVPRTRPCTVPFHYLITTNPLGHTWEIVHWLAIGRPQPGYWTDPHDARLLINAVLGLMRLSVRFDSIDPLSHPYLFYPLCVDGASTDRDNCWILRHWIKQGALLIILIEKLWLLILLSSHL